jgi:ATP-dependent Lhr-like helicase
MRAAFKNWQSMAAASGYWYRLERPEPETDPLDELEASRERARLLLDRHGVLMPRLLDREPPGFRFRDVFSALRLMELAGEVVSGLFFEGAPGPQFAARKTLGLLMRGLPTDRIWWMSAADPAALTGLGPVTLTLGLPRRLDSTHLAFRGNEPLFISEGSGKRLTIRVEPDDPALPGLLAPLHHLLGRAFQPLRHIRLEFINGEAPRTSDYLEALASPFRIVTDHQGVTLYRAL